MKNNQKIIVYSANIGSYDIFKELVDKDPNVEYILFSDVQIESNTWVIKEIPKNISKLDFRRQSRYLKLNPHLVLPEHDISIWIDHSITLKVNDITKLLETIEFDNKTDIMCYKHSRRICIYDEAKEVLKLKLDSKLLVDNQVKKYYSMGFPSKYGLYEAGFIIRNNNNKMKTFNDMWWNEVKNNSARDQLSQMYVSWYTNINIKPIKIGENIYKNELLSVGKHHLKRYST
jgi:hypothetical protein